MSTATALSFLFFVFPLSELALVIWKRAKPGMADRQDRGSLRLLWTAIGVGLALATAAQWASFARLPVPRAVLQPVALVVLFTGLAVRWVSILTLGRFFTVDVAIQPGHRIVRTGLYRRVRHPSYTGLLVAFLGLGLAFANWLSLLSLLVPISLAVTNRVAREEEALHAALGEEYATYCRQTKRLVPGLF
jgi:protein-S-isoprenylcysteine O-methyltransferase